MDPNSDIYPSLATYVDKELDSLIRGAEDFFTERLVGMKTKSGQLDFHNTLLQVLAGAICRRQSLFAYGRLLDNMPFIGAQITCVICGKPIPCEHTSVGPDGGVTTVLKGPIPQIHIELDMKADDDG